MEHQNHDKSFVSTFVIVMGVLFAIFAVCVTAARLITPKHEPSAEAIAQIADRTEPVAMVVTDAAALTKLLPAPVARAPMSGEQVVTKVCATCHTTGLLGAPKMGDHADWGKRKSAAGGEAEMIDLAIKGIRSMPPRGGDASLSDDEMKQAVEFMLAK